MAERDKELQRQRALLYKKVIVLPQWKGNIWEDISKQTSHNHSRLSTAKQLHSGSKSLPIIVNSHSLSKLPHLIKTISQQRSHRLFKSRGGGQNSQLNGRKQQSTGNSPHHARDGPEMAVLQL